MRHLTCLLILAVVALVGACATTPPETLPDPALEPTIVGDYDRVRPVRVLVRPVDATAGVDAPLEAIRRGFYEALIERLYAPLRLDLDPALVPEDPAQGTLVVRLTAWDRSRDRSNGLILASGEAFLVTGDRTIWQARFEDLRLRCRRLDRELSPSARDEMAAAALGGQVLKRLPLKGD